MCSYGFLLRARYGVNTLLCNAAGHAGYAGYDCCTALPLPICLSNRLMSHCWVVSVQSQTTVIQTQRKNVPHDYKNDGKVRQIGGQFHPKKTVLPLGLYNDDFLSLVENKRCLGMYCGQTNKNTSNAQNLFF